MTGARPRIELYPLDRAAEAYERMMSGKAVPRCNSGQAIAREGESVAHYGATALGHVIENARDNKQQERAKPCNQRMGLAG